MSHTAWFDHARCPSCGFRLPDPEDGLALCACGAPILVEREVLTRWRVTRAPHLEPEAAAEAYVRAVVEGLGLALARACRWAR